ncbi:MAG: hypothetical protein JWN35_362, partial [Frankiales bacterium]|nr:hypothetical protein [Frankiales bacterium]
MATESAQGRQVTRTTVAFTEL